MSRIDENGVRHPTDEDEVTHQANVHIAHCRECSPYALPLNIVTPCHGMPLTIYTTPEGRAYMQSDVPSEIVCSAPGCYNSWTPDGTPE